MLTRISFQYADELTKWVNNNIKIHQIVSITSKGKHGGEGYVLFYEE